MANNANTDTDQQPQAQGFLAHLFELRDRLLRIVLALGIGFVVLAPFAQNLYDILSEPMMQSLPNGQTLIATGVLSVVFSPLKLVLILSFLITLPYTMWQIWGFIAPGLYNHEKRVITPLVTSSILLFYLGVLFAYFIVMPMIFSVLQAFAPDNVAATPDIAEYLDFVIMMSIAFGFGFEMPIATILLIVTGISTRESLRQKRPYIVVGSFIVGMFLTPPDVVSQIMLAIPMWLLFEIGLITSKMFEKQIDAARKAREKKDQAEREAMEEEELTEAEKRTMHATAAGAAGGAAAGAAGAHLWEDDDYEYDEFHDEHGNYIHDDEHDFEDYTELTDEELDAEMAKAEAEFDELDAQEDTAQAEKKDSSDKSST